ncbi:uncharacterized protein EI90DRAFT_3291488 [Cantharellus anzutake]|uniref:uncharacterized protein n=1 Tax=Cantharellus anzutake TaxID=1750568 RepID=UPI001906B1C6|nr:uncharacterized protein EI90DRAFT_3291488 [Cantharellus anzutake]KAF8326003.1 hypothetical protein EI90DRAFT_3291488 [Cantharellus anzutake]
MHLIHERCREFVLGQGTTNEHLPGTRKRWDLESSPVVLQVQCNTTTPPNHPGHTVAYQDDVETSLDEGCSEESQSLIRPDKTILQFPIPQWAHYLHAKAKDTMATRENRRHVLGILANLSNITFWYFDRGGGFYSAPIDITSQPHEIISTLVQLALSTAFSLGLEPIMQSSDPWDSLDTMETTTITVKNIPFLIHDTLHVSHDIEGRGLVLFSARKEADCEPGTIPNDVVIKLSWEDPSSPTSDSLYCRAEQHGVRGVLYCSSALGRFQKVPENNLG